MISSQDLYSVITTVVPLYSTMFLAYGSVKWWHIFSPDQCAGINRFVAIFAVPLLSFEFISRINPYKMDLLFIAADGVSKVLVLSILFSWAKLSKRGNIDWVITNFSILTLPNTLVMGIPLLKSMYGDDKERFMIQTVALQCIIWYTLLLFLFEYREAKIEIMEKHKRTSSSSGDGGSGTSTSTSNYNVDNDGVVNVIVAAPSASPQIVQKVNKVAPESRFKRVVADALESGREVHLFIWRCGCCTSQGVCEQSVEVCKRSEDENKIRGKDEEDVEQTHNVPSSVSSKMLKQILKMVWFKLLTNPNSYASILGLSWALVSCRWNIRKPQILDNSVTILSNAGLGMAMFSLGLFMALQPKIISCGKKLALYGMIARFVGGPAVMAIASLLVGLRGTVLRLSIVQAALPQGIVPFVFAREYNLHPHVLSTAVIFGMIISLPITIMYYFLLGL